MVAARHHDTSARDWRELARIGANWQVPAMTAFDINILLHARRAGSPVNAAARDCLTGNSASEKIGIGSSK